MRLALLLAALATVLHCANPTPPAARARPAPPKTSAADERRSEKDNLLDLGRGAVVVSRTGEASLENAALLAVDGNRNSTWLLLPNDIRQSMVVALAGLTRIEQVGLSNGALSVRDQSPGTVLFEGSLDGKEFRPLARVRFEQRGDALLVAVMPTEARFIRASIVDALVPGAGIIAVPSLQVRGQQLEGASPGNLTGCWSINGTPARLIQHGSHVSGATQEKIPRYLEGGSDGRVIRLAWLRGPDFGDAAVTVTRDGQHLSALNWHEEIIPLFGGPSWYGERTACPAESGGFDRLMDAFLEKRGWFPLYAIPTDARGEVPHDEGAEGIQLLAQFLSRNPSRRVRIVAHDFHGATDAENQARTERQIRSLQAALVAEHVNTDGIDFVAAGSKHARQEVITEVQRAMYSAFELEPAASHALTP
jgi:hypothetical protein